MDGGTNEETDPAKAMISIIASVVVSSQKVPTQNVLFLGNSHTTTNDLPEMVMNLVESDRTRRRFNVTVRSGANLEQIAKSAEVKKLIQTGKFSDVVLQGASLSSSHKYDYSQAGAISLAKLAKHSKSKVWYFAEWPRKGWKETPYILGIYQQIAKEGGGKIIPICKVWDAILKHNPRFDLWSADGNHASLLGSYTAALTIAAALTPEAKPTWGPRSLGAEHLYQILGAIRSSQIPKQ
jgi:hypothetical protein